MASEIKPGIDGLYAVCFFNEKAYDEQKIREIFGRYGRVVSVRFWGQGLKAMVFVRYREYNETKHCLDDLNKTNELAVKMALATKKLPEGVPNQQQTGSFKFSGDNGISKNEVSSPNSSDYRKPFYKNFKQSNRQTNIHPKLGNCHTEAENSSKTFDGKKQNHDVLKTEYPENDSTANGHSEHGPGDDTRGTGGTKRKLNVSNRDVNHSEKEDIWMNSVNRDQVLQQNNTSNGIIDDGPPPLVEVEDMPDLVDGRPKVYAKDVIIANLPPTVKASHVMHLAMNHNLTPVDVSEIETTGIKHNIPFCHLWMVNDFEADLAESVLRGKYMDGQRLLVARAEKLLSGFHDSLAIIETA